MLLNSLNQEFSFSFDDHVDEHDPFIFFLMKVTFSANVLLLYLNVFFEMSILALL